MTSTPCLNPSGPPPSPPGCGIITGQGAQTLTLPGSQNHDWGMPWTTGTVRVQNLAGVTKDPATTFSAMGSDARTPQGQGPSTLVAGATTERTQSGNHFAALEVIRMNFSAGPHATAFLSATASAAVVALLLQGTEATVEGITFAGKDSAVHLAGGSPRLTRLVFDGVGENHTTELGRGRFADAIAIYDQAAATVTESEVRGVVPRGVDRGGWCAARKTRPGRVASGKKADADAILTLADWTVVALVRGEASPQDLHQRGKLRVDGDIRVAHRLGFLKGLL